MRRLRGGGCSLTLCTSIGLTSPCCTRFSSIKGSLLIDITFLRGLIKRNIVAEVKARLRSGEPWMRRNSQTVFSSVGVVLVSDYKKPKAFHQSVCDWVVYGGNIRELMGYLNCIPIAQEKPYPAPLRQLIDNSKCACLLFELQIL